MISSPLRPPTLARFAAASLGAAWFVMASEPTTARADAPTSPPPGIAAPAPPATAEPTKAPAPPRARRPAAPPKAPLPVEMTIVAASPDPPWTLRIVNTGERPIRIAADTRLLTFELETSDKRASKIKCAAPASLRPRSFPTSRELYLEPGAAYVEDFDPRLFCFGDKLDLLKGGTTVRAHLGWPKSSTFGKPSFAAQGTDRPEAFAAATELSAPPILLSYAAFAPMAPGVGKPAPGASPAMDTGAHGKTDEASKDAQVPWTERKSNGSVEPSRSAAKESHRYGFGPKSDPSDDSPTTPDAPEVPTDDRNAGKVDVYIDRYADAEAPRDAVVSIRAVNEGRRELSAALRGRMLSFTIEKLGPDNKAQQSFDCRGSDRPHAMPIETLRDLDAGQTVSIPVMLAEICPRETFERPGLYRVRPRIDTAVEGEVLKRSPYIGRALAAQSSLVRIATSRKPFQDEPPKAFTPPAPPAATDATKDDDADDDTPTP